MTKEEYKKNIMDSVGRYLELLFKKTESYVGEEDDPFYNFKVSAELQNITPEQALSGYLAKHTVSIYEMIQDPYEYSIDIWEEKIGDHVNYLLILRALLDDSREKQGL